METVPRRDEQVRGQVGQSVTRVEDQRLLVGKGRFVDDLEPVANIAHASILRSTQAHAKIVSIDTAEAEEAPGVLGVLTGEDVQELSKPFPLAVNVPVNYYSMATDRVRYVGEPMVVPVGRPLTRVYACP